AAGITRWIGCIGDDRNALDRRVDAVEIGVELAAPRIVRGAYVGLHPAVICSRNVSHCTASPSSKPLGRTALSSSTAAAGKARIPPKAARGRDQSPPRGGQKRTRRPPGRQLASARPPRPSKADRGSAGLLMRSEGQRRR